MKSTTHLAALVGAAALLVAALTGCGNEHSGSSGTPVAASAVAAAPIASVNMTASAPDVGKLSTVSVTAQGFGGSVGEAVSEAMKLAILQVNGAAVDTESLSVKYGLDVTLNQDSASLRANSFTDAVRQKSGGVIQNFKVLELLEPTPTSPRFKARIEATIAKFDVPSTLKRLKVVVAPLKTDAATLTIGDQTVSAAEFSSTVRQRIQDALVGTGRFAVLDREASADIDQELAMISSGAAPSAERAKASQAATADIIWSAKLGSLGYNRHARALRASGRELVSYSGGWDLTQKLVNVATRQVIASNSLNGALPETEPTTMSTGVDSQKILATLTDDLVSQVVSSILRQTFPVTVVSRDGNDVVLSQGGQMVHEGARYAMAILGKELKDPQTGESLGRTEKPCCEVVVDRVTPNLSYGHLEAVKVALDSTGLGGLQLREELKAASPVKTANSDEATAVAEIEHKPMRAPAIARSKGARIEPDASSEGQPTRAANDSKW